MYIQIYNIWEGCIYKSTGTLFVHINSHVCLLRTGKSRISMTSTGMNQPGVTSGIRGEVKKVSVKILSRENTMTFTLKLD